MAIDTMKKGSIEMLTLFCCVKKTHTAISLCRKSRSEAKVSYRAGGVFLSASVPLGG